MIKDYLYYLSVTADVLTIIGLSVASIWGIIKKNKSLTGFRINLFLSYFLKTALIIFISILIFFYSRPIYEAVLVITKGKNTPLLWENGKEIQHLISYFISSAAGISIFWLIATMIWTSSLVYVIGYINLFLPKSLKIKTDKYRNIMVLDILMAEYKTDNSHSFDVTGKIKEMVKNNMLKITASNNLAGDPHPHHVKNLIIDYMINGIEKREVIREGETKIIPS